MLIAHITLDCKQGKFTFIKRGYIEFKTWRQWVRNKPAVVDLRWFAKKPPAKASGDSHETD